VESFSSPVLRYTPGWFEITGWESNPSGYGAILARIPSRDRIELLQLAPSLESSPDPASVGAPFETWTAEYTLKDLGDSNASNIQKALDYADDEDADLEELQPHDRTLVIARALMLWGQDVEDGGPAWVADIPEAQWAHGKHTDLLMPAERAYRKKFGGAELHENPGEPLDPEDVLSLMHSDLVPAFETLDVPFVATRIYRLGPWPGLGASISLDPKSSWSNGIFENSRSAKFMIGYDHRKGKWELEMLTRGPGVSKIRKYSTPDLSKLVKKIQSLPSLMDR